jgi:hypothetical protein
MYPPANTDQLAKLRRYYERQYAGINARIYWGSAAAFCAELDERWQAAT